MQVQSQVQVMGIDAGGTMTDTFFVREDGRFVVGKAQSNPADESLAIYNSSIDALSHWEREVDDVFPELVTCVYSGTAMLNRVVQRKGLDVGLMVNKGFEHVHSMGRAIQSYLGYALEERIHLNTHRYDEPLVPLKRTRGVTERSDVQGKVVIPLREAEVRQSTRELVAVGAKAIVICSLQSHKNGTSEQRARDVCLDELKKLGSDIPVFASVDDYPQRKESHRMNTTILEAYAAEPSRQTLKKVSDRFKKHGAKFDLRVMATHGGTSFDMALITKGSFAIAADPDMTRLVLSPPPVTMDSVGGGGAGSFVRLDELGEMPLDMQPQRLRVLEQGVIYRLGDNAPRKVDFRLVAVTGLRIPPMRERPADIALLARLAAYPWPGNVRELRNVIEAAVLTSPDRPLQVQQLQLDPSIFSGLAWATERVQEIPSMAESEEQLIVRAIAACDGNLTRSAKHLNIAKSTLYAKMQRYGLRG